MWSNCPACMSVVRHLPVGCVHAAKLRINMRVTAAVSAPFIIQKAQLLEYTAHRCVGVALNRFSVQSFKSAVNRISNNNIQLMDKPKNRPNVY